MRVFEVTAEKSEKTVCEDIFMTVLKYNQSLHNSLVTEAE